MAGAVRDRAGRGIRAGRPGDRGGPARAQAQRAARAVARQAPLAGAATRAWRARSPGWCRSTTTTTPRSSAPTMPARRSPRAAAPASSGCRASCSAAGARTLERTAEASPHISDLQFTESYRVPFQFSPRVAAAAAGRVVRRVVGGRAGHRSRRQRPLRPHRLVRRQPARLRLLQGLHGARRGRASPSSGPVLGHYPSLVADNVARLARISGKAEVSFHMSGTEAVMQAVRLARYHTGRSHAVVLLRRLSRLVGRRAARRRQPGAGARDLHAGRHVEAHAGACCARGATSPACWSTRCRRCTPTAARPADSTLVAQPAGQERRSRRLRGLAEGAARGLHRARHRADLRRGLRRLPRWRLGGAQEYFGVDADIVTYGKTVGGGFPIGVVCGDHRFMKRFRDDRPADICFARGTFNSHPYVMAAMNEFLLHLETPEHAGALPRPRRDLGSGAPPRSTGGWPSAACRIASPISRRSGRSATPPRRATTGCSSTTSGQRAWR